MQKSKLKIDKQDKKLSYSPHRYSSLFIRYVSAKRINNIHHRYIDNVLLLLLIIQVLINLLR